MNLINFILLLLAILSALFLLYPLRLASKKHLSVIFLILFFIIFYLFINNTNVKSWALYKQKQQRLAQAEKILKKYPDKQSVINSLKTHLDRSQKSAKGWFLLGRLYSSDGDLKNALSAYKMAKTLRPDSEQYQVEYLLTLWQLENRLLSTRRRLQWEQVLLANPNQPQALMVLAMDAYRQHNAAKAILLWSRLLKLVPPNSDDARIIEQSIEKAKNLK